MHLDIRNGTEQHVCRETSGMRRKAFTGVECVVRQLTLRYR